MRLAHLTVAEVGTLILLRQNSGLILGILKSLTGTECKNWERGRSVSFLGIFVSNFRYSVAGEVGTRYDLYCDRSSKKGRANTQKEAVQLYYLLLLQYSISTQLYVTASL